MGLLGSFQHTAQDTRRWTIKYEDWLDNTATVDQVDITSSSETCTVSNFSILGKDVIFYLSGGILGETLTVTITITDSFDNDKTDTISFHVVAP